MSYGGPGGRSRIVEYDPRTNALEWIYTGTRENPFWSKTAGSQQRLPNGNTLVTSSLFGRAFEITTEGEIVWEFRNPVRLEASGETWVPLILNAQRLAPESLDFVDAGSADNGG